MSAHQRSLEIPVKSGMREGDSQQSVSSYDPFSPERPPLPIQSSLLDTLSEDEHSVVELSSSVIPGGAGFLEMEPEPLRVTNEPIKTTSGLFLTHRRTPESNYLPNNSSRKTFKALNVVDSVDGSYFRSNSLFGAGSMKRPHHDDAYSSSGSLNIMWNMKQLLSYARMWVLVSAAVLFVGLMVVYNHMHMDGKAVAQPKASMPSSATQKASGLEPTPIFLLPLPQGGLSQLVQQQEQPPARTMVLPRQSSHNSHRHLLAELRGQFEDWVVKHGKMYRSHHEKEHRFSVWVDNHHKTAEKNDRHGPCTMTRKPVFGSNGFKDLTSQEFQAQYLTGYKGKPIDQEQKAFKNHQGVLGPHIVPTRHPEVNRRLQAAWNGQKIRRLGSSSGVLGTNCKWYDVSCFLSYVMETYFYGIGKTMEPKYDSDSYPTSVDWRDLGAVGDVRAQGDCGACWAITGEST